MKDIYRIVALAGRIDNAAINLLSRRTAQGPKIKLEEMPEIKDFENTVTAFLKGSPENSKDYFRRIQANLINIFSEANLAEAYKVEDSVILNWVCEKYHFDAKAKETTEQLAKYRNNPADLEESQREAMDDLNIKIQKRFKGFFRNQILWHSGIIDELRLDVDRIDVPLAHTDIPKKQGGS